MADSINKLEIASANWAEEYMKRNDRRLHDVLSDAFVAGFKKGVESQKHVIGDVPVKHGEWIEEGRWSEGCGMGENYGCYWRCSSCNEIMQGGYYKCGANFCPNCGAKMEEGEQE